MGFVGKEQSSRVEENLLIFRVLYVIDDGRQLRVGVVGGGCRRRWNWKENLKIMQGSIS